MASKLPAQVGDPRVAVSMAQLRSLEHKASKLTFLPRQPAHSVLNGRHASRLRGRGLNFEELRGYLPGDDVRTIDWKVTARTGEPHVRVMTEERDRPSLIVVDQRMSMFFGSRHLMKSVVAAEAAALAAYRILRQGDRIGGIVFGDRQLAEIRPQRSRAALDRFLTAICAANQLLHAAAPAVAPMPLAQVLRAVRKIAPRNHLIIVLSDFDVLDDETEALLAGLSQCNDLILGLISDPMAQELPADVKMVVSDGRLQIAVDTGDQHQRRSLAELAGKRLAPLFEWQNKHGFSLLPLTTAEDTLPQIERLMGFHHGG